MTQPQPSETRAAELSGAIQRADNDLVLSFLRVRRAIGLLGFFLPAALIAYGLAFGGGILPSMSDYYYSPMREISSARCAPSPSSCGATRATAPAPANG